MKVNLANIKQNFLLIISIIICAFLVFYNLGDIEFWGEDEGNALLNASRFIIGFLKDSQANKTALYSFSALKMVVMVIVPFIPIFGVCELASRVPNAVMTFITLFVIFKIGSLFLNKRNSGLLALFFAVSGATGIFKSSLGIGIYLFFMLLGFYMIEKFLYNDFYENKQKSIDFQLGLIFITISMMFVLDAYFYIPFFILLIIKNIKRIGLKRLLLSLIIPVILFISFFYLEFILERKLNTLSYSTYDHIMSRRGGINFTFNIRPLILGYIHNYSIYIVALFFISIIILIILRLKKIIKIPGTLTRVFLLFLLPGIFWFFLSTEECGHLMHSYPVLLLTIIYSYGSITDFLKGRNPVKIKVGIRKGLLVSMNVFIVLVLLMSFYHTFILFNDLSLDKNKYIGIYLPYRVPCGSATGRKIGMKSIAYLLRQEKRSEEILVSDKGGAFSFIYMGGNIAPLSSIDAIGLIRNGRDIYKEFKIRYVGISADFEDYNYIKLMEEKGYNKIIVKHKGKDIYYVYDLLARGKLSRVIDRDQYDKEYMEKYSNLYDALPVYF